MMKIKEEHINHTQDIFIQGKCFDKERIDFINNLETCDLLAVPGSGKTTVLMAKLYCLAQQMPFEDGSGILVLAHTNHAVDEIEKKLKKHCPQLFEYPNFVGTIQSFVNKFLAIPYYVQKNKSKFRIIDDEEYEREFDYYLNNVNGAVAYFKNKDKSMFYKSRLNLKDDGVLFICIENLNSEIQFNCPQKWTTENTKESKIKELQKFIKNTKIKLFEKGVLIYDDCYFYAKQYLFKYPQLKNILQKRFKYVFIDEMQDLEKFQIEIIDDIFYSSDSKTIIQRVGDKNQAIYNSGKKVKAECDWKPREPKYLNNSHRLTKEIADLVNYFTLDPEKNDNNEPRFQVVGLNGLENPIMPHLILFDEHTTGEQLQQRFEDLIKEHKLHETDSGLKNGFKIIGWSTAWDNDEQKEGKIRLKDLFPDYQKEGKQKKENFDCLKKHLQLFNQEKQTLEAVRKSILNALVRILYLEGIYLNHESKKYYRKRDLIDFMQKQGEEAYDKFKGKLFEWSFNLVTKKEYQRIYEDIKTYIHDEFIKLDWYNEGENLIPKSINKSLDFSTSSNYDFTPLEQKTEHIEENKKGFDIEISSVHSAKGQTHCATMYIETSYHKYETKKKQIKEALIGKKHDLLSTGASRGIEALKMMYVGFSRPTHLLCFAVLKQNIGDTTTFSNWDIPKENDLTI